MRKKILCAINPASGKGGAMKMVRSLEHDFPYFDWKMIESKGPNFLSQVFSPVLLADVSLLVVLGGDGTMHDAVNALYKNNRMDLPVLLFPAGSGNAFNYDLACLDYATAANRLRKMQAKKIDLMEINYGAQSCIAFNMIGWGLVSAINKTAERWRFMGNARYTLASIGKLMGNPSEGVKLNLDGNLLEGDFSFVLILNNQHTGKGMKMAPLAILDDGLMDVLLVRKTSLKNLLLLFPKIYSGAHIHSSLLEYRQVKNISLTTSSKQSISIDGELKGTAPFSVKVLAKQLTIIY